MRRRVAPVSATQADMEEGALRRLSVPQHDFLVQRCIQHGVQREKLPRGGSPLFFLIGLMLVEPGAAFEGTVDKLRARGMVDV